MNAYYIFETASVVLWEKGPLWVKDLLIIFSICHNTYIKVEDCKGFPTSNIFPINKMKHVQ